MKKLLFITLVLSFMSVSCLNSERTTPGKKSTTGGGTSNSGDDVDTNTANPGTESGTGSGVTCHGNSNDGYGDGAAIITQGILLGGTTNWLPGVYSGLGSSMPTINEARILFSSDSRLKVRLKVHPQPNTSAYGNDEYCYGRNTGISIPTYDYDNLWVAVSIRDVKCREEESAGYNPATDPNVNVCDYNNDGQQNDSDFQLGTAYGTQFLGPIAVNECSPVLNLSNSRNPNKWGAVLQIHYIENDSFCQQVNSETYCPKFPAHAGTCWQATMQVVNDFTQDFK